MENNQFLIMDSITESFLCFDKYSQYPYYLKGGHISPNTLSFKLEFDATFYLKDFLAYNKDPHFNTCKFVIIPFEGAITKLKPLPPNFIIYHPKSNEVVNWNKDPNGNKFFILQNGLDNPIYFENWHEAKKELDDLSLKNPFINGCEVIRLEDYNKLIATKPLDLLDFDQDDMPAPVKPKRKRNIIVSFDHHFWTPLKMSFPAMHYLLISFAALAILTGNNYALLITLIIICLSIAGIFFLNAVIHYITFRSIDNYLMGYANYLMKQQVNAAKRRK